MPNFEPVPFNPTAFMSGQTLSKLWLCHELETQLRHLAAREWLPSGRVRHHTVWILAGWYGLTNLLLRARNGVPITKVVSIDQDPQASKGALVLNEAFVYQNEFETRTQDINTLDYTTDGPTVVINTACEHMADREWFDRIPTGTVVAIQSNDMTRDEHVALVDSVEDFAAQYPLSEVLMSGEIPFQYETWSFRRFMIIGIK